MIKLLNYDVVSIVKCNFKCNFIFKYEIKNKKAIVKRN